MLKKRRWLYMSKYVEFLKNNYSNLENIFNSSKGLICHGDDLYKFIQKDFYQDEDDKYIVFQVLVNSGVDEFYVSLNGFRSAIGGVSKLNSFHMIKPVIEVSYVRADKTERFL